MCYNFYVKFRLKKQKIRSKTSQLRFFCWRFLDRSRQLLNLCFFLRETVQVGSSKIDAVSFKIPTLVPTLGSLCFLRCLLKRSRFIRRYKKYF